MRMNFKIDIEHTYKEDNPVEFSVYRNEGFIFTEWYRKGTFNTYEKAKEFLEKIKIFPEYF